MTIPAPKFGCVAYTVHCSFLIHLSVACRCERLHYVIIRHLLIHNKKAWFRENMAADTRDTGTLLQEDGDEEEDNSNVGRISSRGNLSFMIVYGLI